MASNVAAFSFNNFACSFDYDPTLKINSLSFKGEGYNERLCWVGESGSEIELLFEAKWAELVTCLVYNRESLGGEQIFESFDALEAFVKCRMPLRSPEEKLLAILEFIYDKLDYPGDRCSLLDESDVEEFVWRRFYLVDIDEFVFYIESLNSFGWIVWQGKTDQGYLGVTLSIVGLQKVFAIRAAKESRYCFVAMSFSKELEEVYDKAIVPALAATRFTAVRIDRENVPSGQTVNDAIIAGLRKSLFTIADFTEHKAGVYFEAGFAMGLGQTLIMSCREDDISCSHFDTRNYQHLVWKDDEDLKLKLINRIQAIIGSAYLGN